MHTVTNQHSVTHHDDVERLPSLMGLFFASVLGALGGIAVAMLLFGFAYREEFVPAISKLMPFDEVVEVAPQVAQPIVEPEPIAEETKTGLSPKEYLDAFVWTTRVRLDDLGLGQSLKVSASPDGEIVIRGTLLKTHAGRYNVFKGWFQSRKTYPPLVDEVNFVKISGLFPKIKSVWLGDKPAVHLDNGQNATVGSIFGDGWKIVEIGRLALKLERDGTIIELSYADS